MMIPAAIIIIDIFTPEKSWKYSVHLKGIAHFCIVK